MVCAHCMDIQALTTKWRTCSCGNTSARWVDPLTGTAEFSAVVKEYAFLLGLNNQLLGPALQGKLGMWQDFRMLHDVATNAPNHVFDKSRANCWAVIVSPGRTSDVTWSEEDPRA